MDAITHVSSSNGQKEPSLIRRQVGADLLIQELAVLAHQKKKKKASSQGILVVKKEFELNNSHK
jgi:hypothetical protein